MLERLKQVVVESYLGAIALGYLLAQAILYFVNIFAAPVAQWASGKIYQGIAPRTAERVGFPLQAALPPLVSFVVLLLIWYVLLRWLYFTTPKREPVSNQDPIT